MRFLPVVFVMICACGAPQPKASGPAPASASTQPPVATDTRIAPEIAEGPATAAPTPSAPLVMVDEPLSATAENATTKLLARGAVGASIAADGKTLLVVPRGRGAEIRDLQGKLLHQLKTHHVERSAFSPDSKFVALDEENGSTSVFETDTGQFVQSNKGDHPAFLDNRRLGLRDGCHARVVDVTRAATAATLGKACGTVVHTSLDYGTWWVATPGRFRLGVLQTFATLDEVHLPSGRRKSLIQGGAGSFFLEPIISKGGSRLCFLQSDLSLHCSTLTGPPAAFQLHGGPVLRNPVFDAAGDQVLFSVGPGEHAPRDVFIADLRTQRVRRVLKANHEWWDFLPGGTRIVGHGGPERLTVYDVAADRAFVVGRAGEEWEGLSLMPGSAERFIAGKERGGTRDLFWVDLPR